MFTLTYCVNTEPCCKLVSFSFPDNILFSLEIHLPFPSLYFSIYWSQIHAFPALSITCVFYQFHVPEEISPGIFWLGPICTDFIVILGSLLSWGFLFACFCIGSSVARFLGLLPFHGVAHPPVTSWERMWEVEFFETLHVWKEPYYNCTLSACKMLGCK